jgi:hypothetical protein
MALAREAGRLLTWDQSHTLCLFDQLGTRVHATRLPAPLLSARICDDGSKIALLVGGPRLLVLDSDFQVLVDRPAVSGATSLDIDPHGRFVVLATRQSDSHFYTCHGKPIGKFETKQPLTHVRFVASLPLVIGAAGYGVMVGVAIEPTSPGASLKAQVVWEERLMSNLGRLEVTGDGAMILASCFNLGIQRYDAEGHNEGSYHVGGTAIHAVPDFPGRIIAVATQEGEIALLNRAGNIRWKSELGRPPVALEIDALGRYFIYGLETGDICRFDIEESGTRQRPRAAGPNATRAPASTLREPVWSVEIARSDDEAQGAVLALLDEPPRIASMTRGNRLHIFDTQGNLVHRAPEILGIGRIIRTAPGSIAAATDRQILLYEAHEDTSRRVDLDLHELTHLVARPEQYGLAIVQERDRLGRATTAGRWVWKKEYKSPIEEIATGPMGLTAVSCDDGILHILDAAGEPSGRFVSDPPEPLLLAESPTNQNVTGVVWITLARRSQILRGHSADGRVVWESPTPWEGWQLVAVGICALVIAPDGRCLAFDSSGFLQFQGRTEDSTLGFAPAADSTVSRIARRDSHLICSQLDGQVRWRAVCEASIGPAAASRLGVAAVIGRELAWFGNDPAT